MSNKSKSGFLSLVFSLSGITLTILLSMRPMPVYFYLAEFVLCSIIWGVVAFKYRIVDNALKNSCKLEVICSVMLAAAFIPTHYQSLNYLIIKFVNENAGLPASFEPYLSFFLSHKLLFLIPVIAFAAVSLCFIFIFVTGRIRNTVVDFFKGLAKYEKIFLITGSMLYVIIILILFNLTNVFYLPSNDGTVIPFDVIYSSDTGAILEKNCYVNPSSPENDLKQPLFGIFALPFGLSAKLISFFIPTANSYPVCMNIIQIILMFITMILISRMLEASKTIKIFFLLILTVTFPFMLFALNMEQYIFAVFWTILLIYNSYTTRKTNVTLSVAATGSILTSAILIPLLMVINKEYGTFMKKGFKMLIVFFSVFICGGMMEIVYKFNLILSNYGSFVSKHGFIDKCRQFTHFIASCFIAPCSQIVSKGDTVTYQQSATGSNHILGISIFGLSLLSGFLFRRQYMAKISLYWAGFAFALICLFGWGTAENGTVLYSLYLFWAFTVLLTLLINKLPTRINYVKYFIFVVLVVALFVYNIMKMIDIINFGLKYYPVS